MRGHLVAANIAIAVDVGVRAVDALLNVLRYRCPEGMVPANGALLHASILLYPPRPVNSRAEDSLRGAAEGAKTGQTGSRRDRGGLFGRSPLTMVGPGKRNRPVDFRRAERYRFV